MSLAGKSAMMTWNSNGDRVFSGHVKNTFIHFELGMDGELTPGKLKRCATEPQMLTKAELEETKHGDKLELDDKAGHAKPELRDMMPVRGELRIPCKPSVSDKLVLDKTFGFGAGFQLCDKSGPMSFDSATTGTPSSAEWLRCDTSDSGSKSPSISASFDDMMTRMPSSGWADITDDVDIFLDPTGLIEKADEEEEDPIPYALDLEDSPRRTISWSVGAAGHADGRCKPCAWNWKPSGCSKGRSCTFCHMCEDGELKKQKKERVANMRRRKANCRNSRVAMKDATGNLKSFEDAPRSHQWRM